MKHWWVLFAVAGCGGMKSAAVSGAPPAAVASPSPSSSPSASTATTAIATGEAEHFGAPGITAGVWDDNQNFEWFAAYARRVATSPDLAAFTADEQQAARDRSAARSHRELDIQLVIDTTGSMGDELAYLQRELSAIGSAVAARHPNVTPRWSLVVYKDRGDEYVERSFDFTADLASFQRTLGAQSAGGGGDFPEAVIPAFTAALQQHWRTAQPEVAKLVFWVADAPPHAGEGNALAALARQAARSQIHVYPIASSGIDDATEYQMRATAQLTGGRYIFLTDDSGIGSSHAEPHIPCYTVTRLDHAILRMIDSELSGQRVPVAGRDVLRTVGHPDPQGTCRMGEAAVVAF